MLENNYYEPDILSKREVIYKSVLNCKVVSMVRYGLEPKEQFKELYSINNSKDAFSLSEGTLLIEFDNGTSIAFNSDKELSSIISWIEKINYKKKPNSLAEDADLFPIYTNDLIYSTNYLSDIINKKLVKFEIIKQKPFSLTYYSLPREVGLVLYFPNDTHIVISHQLTKLVPDNFTILKLADIEQEIYSTLYKESRFW